MNMQSDNFCRKCGTKLEEHKSTSSFDGKTGKPITRKHCTNLQCKEGCEYAGHQWGSIWTLSHEKCKRCGHVVFQGY